jgi:hypothetical protein
VDDYARRFRCRLLYSFSPPLCYVLGFGLSFQEVDALAEASTCSELRISYGRLCMHCGSHNCSNRYDSKTWSLTAYNRDLDRDST